MTTWVTARRRRATKTTEPRLIINYTLGGPPANTAPSVVLTSPSDLDTFSEGTEINFTGMATDDLDGKGSDPD